MYYSKNLTEAIEFMCSEHEAGAVAAFVSALRKQGLNDDEIAIRVLAGGATIDLALQTIPRSTSIPEHCNSGVEYPGW